MGFNTKKLYTLASLTIIGFATIGTTGCSYKTDCYKPLKKQKFEENVCYKYSDSPFSATRFVYMDDTLWMQYGYRYIIEARDFNVTVNDENETHTTTKFLVLPSDHPLEPFSNLLINVDFLRSYNKINSLSYMPTNPEREFGEKNLWGLSLWSLNRFIASATGDYNKTALKTEANSTK